MKEYFYFINNLAYSAPWLPICFKDTEDRIERKEGIIKYSQTFFAGAQEKSHEAAVNPDWICTRILKMFYVAFKFSGLFGSGKQKHL